MVNQAIERAKTISDELREQIQHDLTKAMRGDVRFDRYTRAIYSTDASIYEMEPVGLVLPRNAEDVAGAIEICFAKKAFSVVPSGSMYISITFVAEPL